MALITSYTVSAPHASYDNTIRLTMIGDHARPWEILRWPNDRVVRREAILWRSENPVDVVIPDEFIVKRGFAVDEQCLFTLAEAMFVCGVANHR
jgi:hypothetical protein